MRKILILILGTFILRYSYSAEFVLMNQEVTLTSANNGFFFIVSPTNGPVDWYTPDNYYNGQVYFRYEVISQPTNEVCYFSFDIWGDYNGSTYTESAAPISGALNGPGSVSTFSSSPSTWYPNPNTGPVNFHNRNTFWRWGLCHWFSKSPNFLLAPVHWSDDPESWEAWSHNSTWLPIKVKVTVVAVSQGSTFSGWQNYISPTKQPTPTYVIDYATEQTNKVVPSTDEYSYNSDMSGATSGTGQKLALTPGQDVYFRTKAANGLLVSDIQHLDVPSRPSAPNYSIDFFNELTVENVSTNTEYCTGSGFPNPTSGTGSKVSLTPGQDLYFRIKATASSFKSSSFMLNVPDRQSTPSVTLDFFNEVTSIIPSTIEYSTSVSMSSASNGNNSAISVTPGTDLYFRTKANSTSFKSSVQSLDVPSRPQLPTITIDYSDEKTSSIESSLEYSANENMTLAQSGENTGINLVPGTDLFFRLKATNSQFRSEVWRLDVPARPAKPAVTFDYFTEKTSVISDIHEYSTNSNMVPVYYGMNQKVDVLPGTIMYFRTRSTSSSFASDLTELIIPQRPAAPAFEIDFTEEKSSVAVEDIFEYSDDPDFLHPVSGANNYIPVLPGSSLYFRQKATNSQFKSLVQELSAPPRPAQQTYTIDFVNETTIEIVNLHDEYTFLENMSQIQTGSDQPLSLIPDTVCFLRIKATSGSFASEWFSLNIPPRPVITTEANDTVNGIFYISVLNEDGTDGFETEDLEIVNASIQVSGADSISVEPLQTGSVSIKLKANAFTSGSFASEPLVVFAQLPVALEDQLLFEKLVLVYPNPMSRQLTIKAGIDPVSFPLDIQLIDPRGTVIYHQVTPDDLTTINTDSLPSGIYFLKASDNRGNSILKKLIKP